MLFADTFNRYFEPENIEAALDVLAAAGYRVIDAARADGGRGRCAAAARSSSVGLVDEARARGASACSRRSRRSSRAACRSSGSSRAACSSSATRFRRCCKTEDARRLAARALLFEEFLAREAAAGRLNLPLKPVAKRALLHGHCHQKAFGAMAAVEATLELVPDLDGRDRRVELLRHGRRVRLRRRHYRRVAARWASCRCCRRCARPRPTR